MASVDRYRPIAFADLPPLPKVVPPHVRLIRLGITVMPVLACVLLAWWYAVPSLIGTKLDAWTTRMEFGTTEIHAATVRAEADLGLKLIRSLSAEHQNVVVSPYSAGSALAMVLAGAKGRTRDEIVQALGLTVSPEEFVSAHKVLNEALAETPFSHDVAVANLVAVTPGVPAPLADYTKTIELSLAAEVMPAATASAVGDWVARQTRGKIRAAAAPQAGYSLLNALYFKAPWSTAFKRSETKPRDFVRADGSIVQVAMMAHKDMRMAVGRGEGYRFARLPYGGDRFAMIVVLPEDVGGLDAVLAGLSGETLIGHSRQLREIKKVKRSVWMPKLTSSAEYGLNDALTTAGIRCAFDAGCADFSAASPYPVFIDKSLQTIFVDVSEAGTEAAAISKMEWQLASSELVIESNDFHVDRPYLFAIVDDATDSVLFLGRIDNPAAASPAS